jgi:membrane fusion protein (multidrug efflux system)
MFRSLGRFFRWIGLRRFILVFVVLICALLVAFNFARTKGIANYFATMKMPPVAVSATKVETSTWNPEIRAIGTLAAIQGVDVSSQVAGVVQTIDFTANQRVKQGDLLVQIDDSVERADLMSAQAAIERDRASMERATRLRKTGVNSDASLEDAASALAASESALAKIRAVLDQKSIEAPFAGTVGIPRIDVGQYVEPGTMIATLQQLETMRVDFTVPEQQVSEVSMGQPATFGLTEDNFGYQGRIVGVDPKIDPQTRLVSVRAEVKNSDGGLRPGQFARVRVELPAVSGVIALPQTAVVTSLYGDYVYVVAPADAPAPSNPAEGDATLRQSLPENTEKPAAAPAPAPAPEPAPASTASSAPAQPPAGEAEKLIARQVFVTVGRRQGDLIEIAKGIEAGQTVITSGQNKLFNNAPVTINNDVDPAKLAREGGDGAS